MAKKKKEEEAPAGSPAWMATFSDLMNLLLCFFVLLFSMSSVDSAKYEKVVESLNNTFSVFSGGGSALDQGVLISSGVSQLNELSEYYSSMGKAATEYDDDGDQTGGNTEDKKNEELTAKEIVEQYEQQQKEATEAFYSKVSDLVDKYDLTDYVELGMDNSDYNFVQMSISGYLLFDSGSAEVKEAARPILNKAGEMLKRFEEYDIMIEGHTDNVPQTSVEKYKNNLWLSSARACAVYDYLVANCNMSPSKLEASGKGEYAPIASNATPEGRQKNRRVEIKIYNRIN
ncbi:MAG: flagellar motor protein MotB [Lachnospiraceae bacterium]|nr:flagellar motor protein MotB [Lachnospiraceae bacterium]